MDEPTDTGTETSPVKSGYGPDASYEAPDPGPDPEPIKSGYAPEVAYDEPPDTGSGSGGTKTGGYPGPVSD